MKHAHTLKRAMAVVLALVLTLSLVTPTWAMSSSSVATKGENNGITWEKVDNIKLPIKETRLLRKTPSSSMPTRTWSASPSC